MARIRTIKPDFFRHSGLYEAEKETGLPLRVAFAGLWTAADREGRFKWKPRELKLDCLPFDEIDFSRVLDALATRGFILKYEVLGVEYGLVPSWSEHQVVNNRESESLIPEPTTSSLLTREARVDDATATPLVQLQVEGKGKEGKGKEERVDASAEFSEILSAYHTKLPNCERVSILTDTRKRAIRNAEKNAKRVCRERGWNYGADFWNDFFDDCAKDPWLAGDVPNPKNAKWKQSLDIILRDDHFAKVIDRALAGAA